MNIAFLRRAGEACLGFVAVAVLLVLAPTEYVAASSPSVLDACINPGNGMMRLVDSSATCHANETLWSGTSPAPKVR